MKITITHDQSSIDPSATYTDSQFEQVIDALEAEYERALGQAYPDAEIEFVRANCAGEGIKIYDPASDDEHDEVDTVQDILETVYETGNFWV